ncbi:polyprenol phosphomannose-dependent alpha 1,6 mannosyltransferase MptB [uncultured Jatrophihabitans sp.]|uniref:polyprenol phosphomannose-dependent alpha 1,6 mannosyltransferase MptB n=1 Tax=uncultured Jatrophihabitans sp. TaxID=1610747 RepID=UPI0035CA723C
MNDLLESALEGLDAARRELREHPMVTLAASGFVVGALVVAAGGRATAARADRPLTSWLGLQDVRSAAIGSAAGSIMLAGVLTLAVLWVAALWLVTRRAIPLTRVWWVAAVWAAPFALGPPLMDTSVYSYVAYGRLLRAGRDPYQVGPASLGDSPIVAAIDPAQRGTPSSAGPLGTALQHLAVSIGNGGLLATVVVWRVIGVLVAVWIARTVADLAALSPGETTPAGAVTACALNPLLLLYVVSSPHLDAVLVALVLAGLLAAAQRRWWRALVLATLGAGIGAAGLVAVVIIAAAHWFGRRRARLWPVIARDSVIVAVVLAVPMVAQSDVWGELRNLRGRFSSDRTPYSIVGAVEKGLSAVVRVASYDDLAAGSGVTAGLAAACIIGYLLCTVRRRPLGLSVGYALLWLGLLAPALHPWYLLWGLLTLLPFATGQARIALVGLSIGACVLTPQGFTGLPQDVVTGVALGALGLASAAALWFSRSPATQLASADT